jgi:hypothetical protein
VNRIRGSIHRGWTHTDPCLYRFHGKWDSRVDITDVNGSHDVLFDATSTPLVRKTVAPIESQTPLESRRYRRIHISSKSSFIDCSRENVIS